MSSFSQPPRVTLLAKHHNREAFDCGEDSLNAYLQRYARQNASRDAGLSYVAVSPDEPTRILGYYTISVGHIERDLLPQTAKFPSYPAPCLLLGRLAVDKSAQGLGIGAFLLTDVFVRAVYISAEAGLFAIEVDALHQKGAAFYIRYGFEPLLDHPFHLFLPLGRLRFVLRNLS